MNALPYLCLGCTRYHRNELQTEMCDAYPLGIPTAILNGASHFDPDPETGDGGLAFDPDPDAGDYLASYLAYWYTMEGSDQLPV
jgi:hypothetical protein